MRTEYPELIRERLWSSATELYQNAARNCIEFAAEGWNWRTVADDEHMILSASGELIHPVHIINSTTPQGSAFNIHVEHVGSSCHADVDSPVSMDTDLSSS